MISPRTALDAAVHDAVASAVDVAEAYAEYVTTLSITSCGDRVTGARHDVDSGVALRTGGGARDGALHTGPLPDTPGGVSGLDEAQQRAVSLLAAAAATAARGADPAVIRAEATLTWSVRRIVVARRDGFRGGEDQVRLRLDVQVLAERGIRRCGGAANGVARSAPVRASTPWAAGIGGRAAVRALRGFDAVEVPTGEIPVLLQGSAAGVWLHEAVGHGLEADLLHGGGSPFAGRMGQAVAAPAVTVVDDGGVPGLGGTVGIDDEGVAPRATVLIEGGALTGALVDRTWAARGCGPLGGNGRRATYRDRPLPRMTCTYIAAGDDDPAELLASIPHGLLCRGMHAGEWDPRRGEIIFTVGEAILIEGGSPGPPVQPVCLVGRGSDLFGGLTGVGDDLTFSDEFHTCTKAGQEVPVGVGAPTLRITGLRARTAH